MREFQLLVGATLYLMSRHAEGGSPQLAGAIVRHPELLGAHPYARRLVRDWSAQLLSD